MAIILKIALAFVVYEIGYYMGYKHCRDYIDEIMDEYEEDEEDEM